MNYSRLTPVLGLAAVFLAACSNSSKTAVTSTSPSKTDGKLYAVTAENAAFFKHGPQSGRTPDQNLPRETVVRLIRPSFGGFSKVEVVASHEQGYVATEEIQPATSALIAAASAPKVDMMRTSPDADTTPPQPAAEQFNLNSDDPRLVPPPEDLPPTELPLPDSPH
ncbi:MAG: hypothetical protein ACJ8M4_03330 [Chthoniobacterales bacterium]